MTRTSLIASALALSLALSAALSADPGRGPGPRGPEAWRHSERWAAPPAAYPRGYVLLEAPPPCWHWAAPPPHHRCAPPYPPPYGYGYGYGYYPAYPGGSWSLYLGDPNFRFSVTAPLR